LKSYHTVLAQYFQMFLFQMIMFILPWHKATYRNTNLLCNNIFFFQINIFVHILSLLEYNWYLSILLTYHILPVLLYKSDFWTGNSISFKMIYIFISQWLKVIGIQPLKHGYFSIGFCLRTRHLFSVGKL